MIKKQKKICVIGLGYIGLPTASMFATHGFQVLGVDTNPHVIETLKKNQIHVEEPGLSTIVKAALGSGNLTVSSKCSSADVFIITVPTPFARGKGKIPKADLSYIESALKSLLPHLKKNNLVILESTSPPGTTTGLVCSTIKKAGFKIGKEIGVAYCPERVIPGRALQELVGNDRVIGAIDDNWAKVTKDLYKCFVSGDIYLTRPSVAEMVKLAENTFRDVNIALANEFAHICENLGINVWEVIRIANRHPRVNLHRPGPGVGGHCISVDPWFLAEKLPKKTQFIQKAREVNDSMPHHVVATIEKLLPKKKSATIAILGITFKGNINDVRESPALEVIKILRKRHPHYQIKVYDPHVQYAGVQQEGPVTVFEKADLVVILSAHDEFRLLDPRKVGELMRRRVLYDTHALVTSSNWVAAGFKVHALGVGEESSVS